MMKLRIHVVTDAPLHAAIKAEQQRIAQKVGWMPSLSQTVGALIRRGLQEPSPPQESDGNKIVTVARMWRAVDKATVRTPPDSPERDAEYRLRQELRKVIDEA